MKGNAVPLRAHVRGVSVWGSVSLQKETERVHISKVMLKQTLMLDADREVHISKIMLKLVRAVHQQCWLTACKVLLAG